LRDRGVGSGLIEKGIAFAISPKRIIRKGTPVTEERAI
jgi:hypothetical protein